MFERYKFKRIATKLLKQHGYDLSYTISTCHNCHSADNSRMLVSLITKTRHLGGVYSFKHYTNIIICFDCQAISDHTEKHIYEPIRFHEWLENIKCKNFPIEVYEYALKYNTTQVQILQNKINEANRTNEKHKQLHSFQNNTKQIGPYR